MSAINFTQNNLMLDQLKSAQAELKYSLRQQKQDDTTSGPSFIDFLKSKVSEVNNSQKHAEKMAIDLTSGKTQNIHETMLAATQAELSFNLMVQIRNKVLEAYQEIMRMPV